MAYRIYCAICNWPTETWFDSGDTYLPVIMCTECNKQQSLEEKNQSDSEQDPFAPQSVTEQDPFTLRVKEIGFQQAMNELCIQAGKDLGKALEQRLLVAMRVSDD